MEELSSMWSLFAQVPVVALFMIFVFWRQKLSDQREKERDSLFTQALESRDEAFSTRMDNSDARWMTYLSAERQQRAASMQHGIEAIDRVTSIHASASADLSKGMASLAHAVATHDSSHGEQYREILRQIQEMRTNNKQ